MPQTLYLHSTLIQDRVFPASNSERRRVIRFSNAEVLLAMGVAGLVNIAMGAMAADVFYANGRSEPASIETAYRTLAPLMGPAAGVLFLWSLLASGLSSSIIGTMAGQSIMQDLVTFRIPLWLRRLVTIIPSIMVVALGSSLTDAFVLSQVVLSLVLPVPMLALLVLTSRREIMGEFANGPIVKATAGGAAGLIVAINVVFLF
jgi:manganese transport protein